MTAEQFANDVRNQNLQLLGEVISWNLPENTVVNYQDLLTALAAAGLDQKVAREMLPRYAFARAAKQLAQQRIIRCIEDEKNGTTMRFQFTKEHLEAGQYRYDYEATLALDKDTGHVSAETSGGDQLAIQAQQLLEKAKNERTTADITRYIMTLFSKQADLFPVRNAGGVYFVPAQHTDFVNKVDKLVTSLRGNVTRFPVPAGTQQGNKSVKEAVQSGLQDLINEHLKAVDEFGTDTRESTLERAVKKIEQTKFKVEAYAQYLEDQRDGLAASLAAVSLTLKQKIEQVLANKARAESPAHGLLE